MHGGGCQEGKNEVCTFVCLLVYMGVDRNPNKLFLECEIPEDLGLPNL